MTLFKVYIPAESVDEYIRIGESTEIASLQNFCRAIAKAEERNFPGCLDLRIVCIGRGRIVQYMAWGLLWQGESRHRNPRSCCFLLFMDLACFFGLRGTLNDINVLDRSPLFASAQNGLGPSTSFRVNGCQYEFGYYLVDGIYLNYVTLISAIAKPFAQKEKLFTKAQESYRKDVERAFGDLQARWNIVAGPARQWSLIDLDFIMKTCIILHSVIVENERDEGDLGNNYYIEPASKTGRGPPTKSDALRDFVSRYDRIRHAGVHSRLQKDIADHLWENHGIH